MSAALAKSFSTADAHLQSLERGLVEGEGAAALHATVTAALKVVADLLRAYIADRAQAAAASGAASPPAVRPAADSDDVLELFKAFVKGDPSLNAVRDNIRELVYYRNCLDLQREDALPAKPAHMAVRTARHIYLYLRTRCVQERRLE